jgi:hypothetical protein
MGSNLHLSETAGASSFGKERNGETRQRRRGQGNRRTHYMCLRTARTSGADDTGRKVSVR